MISFRAHVMAVDRVEQRLRKVAAALDGAGIPYAVIGGNAVACWVGRVDPGATRATKEVDLLVNRADADRITGVMQSFGFIRKDLETSVDFSDPAEPSKRSAVHLVWAGDKARPSHVCPTPTLDEAVRDPEGFLVLDLPALVRMKLTSFRAIDQAHVADLGEVGLIDDSIRSSLSTDLMKRLDEVEMSLEE